MSLSWYGMAGRGKKAEWVKPSKSLSVYMRVCMCPCVAFFTDQQP